MQLSKGFSIFFGALVVLGIGALAALYYVYSELRDKRGDPPPPAPAETPAQPGD